MIFQCSDLERALRFAERMPEALEHAETCEDCHIRLMAELREEWETPSLWPRIQAEIARETPSRKPAPWWQFALVAAAILTLTVALAQIGPPQRPAPDTDFLTRDTLREVEQAEAAYARSIEKLSAVAGPALQQSPSPLAAAYREKLVLLDSGIADIKAQVDGNRYNVYLQDQLASLYREKQSTLKEWLENAKSN